VTWAQKLLSFTIELASGTFSNGTTTNNYEGLRISATVEKTGISYETAEITIFGMNLSDMNKISTLGMRNIPVQRNTITLIGGDSNGMSVIHTGVIMNAFIDFSDVDGASVALRVTTQAALFDAVNPDKVRSYSGPVSVASVLQDIASKMGLTLQNNGVNGVLPKSYWSGSTGMQLVSIARAAGIYWTVDSAKKTLVICPQGGNRPDAPVIISPSTGMIGYPVYTPYGVDVRTLYNNALAIWGRMTIQSSQQQASQTWLIYALTYTLESLVYRGKWETLAKGAFVGESIPQDE
jgi:hypothetical protein